MKKRIYSSVRRLGVNYSNFKITIIKKNHPERENGYSLYLGLKQIKSKYTLLTMSDHVFSKNIFSRMVRHYKDADLLLVTDPMEIEQYYDLDDATKVYGENNKIKKIGKKIIHYNRIDMGVFLLKYYFNH